MRVLVIGSTSVLGRALGNYLTRYGSVSYAGRSAADIHLDLLENHLEELRGKEFDVVVHCASAFGGTQYEDFLNCIQVNVGGTLQACKIAEFVNAKQLVIVSSLFASYKETSSLFNAYALSKKHADEMAALYMKGKNISVTVIRPSQIYDTHMKSLKHQPLFYHIIDKAKNGEDIVFYGNNDALRNYILLDDVVEIIARCIEFKISGMHYCTALKSLRLSQIARVAYNVFNTNGNIVFDQSKADIPSLPSVSSSFLYKKIHYSPKHTLRDGIAGIKRNLEEND